MNAMDRQAWQAAWENTGRKSVLNDLRFIDGIEAIYGCRAAHQIVPGEGTTLGIPCFEVRSLLSGHKLTTCPFNFYPPPIGPQNDEAALEFLIAQARKIGPRCYVEYKTFRELPADFVKGLSLVSIAPSVVGDLALGSNYEKQRQAYAKDLRWYLRRCEGRIQEAGIRLVKAETRREVKDWYRVLVKLYRDKHHMIAQPLGLYERLLCSETGRSFAELLLAKSGDRTLAGIVLFKGKEEWDYSWAARDMEYAAYGLNALLIDWAVRMAIDEGVSILNFGSSSPSDEGLRAFKTSWGCRERKVLYYYWNHRPRAIDLNTSFSVLRKIYSKLPLGLLERIPAFVVPHLA